MGSCVSTSTGPSLEEMVFNEKFAVLHQLGSGSFGHVFVGEDLDTKTKLAIKVETEGDSRHLLLEKESALLASMQTIRCVPRLIWYGRQGKHRVMVSELLGPSLEDLLDLCNPGTVRGERSFGLPTALVIGILTLRAIEEMHSVGYIHRDIKPENVLMGNDNRVNELYLIDLGLAAPAADSAAIMAARRQSRKHLVGTPNFASVRAHDGLPPVPKDDLESVCYLLLYLHTGRLPWARIKRKMQGAKADSITAAIKHQKSLPVADLYRDSAEMIPFYERIRKLGEEEAPNYGDLAGLLEAVLLKVTGKTALTQQCDWNLLSAQSSSAPLPEEKPMMPEEAEE